MTSREKLESMRKELVKKENILAIIENLEEKMKWNAMICNQNENGEYEYTEPTEDDTWYYDTYVAYKEVIELLNKTYFK